MKILFTGASSFTGYHLVNSLLDHHSMICTFRKNTDDYEGIYRERVELIQPKVDVIKGGFGSPEFIDALSNVDLVFHHGAHVHGYQHASFPEQWAIEQNTYGLDLVMEQAQRNGCRIALTQSIFEKEPFSAYSRSKYETTRAFEQSAAKHNVVLKRLVLPNPIGPMCNEKLLFYLCQTWLEGGEVFIKNPHLIRDNLPVDLLAQSVVSWVESDKELLEPSGYCGTNRFWVSFFAEQCRQRCDFATKIIFNNHDNDDKQMYEPAQLCNSESCFERFPNWREDQFWDELIEHLVSRAAEKIKRT